MLLLILLWKIYNVMCIGGLSWDPPPPMANTEMEKDVIYKQLYSVFIFLVSPFMFTQSLVGISPLPIHRE